jgi:hypothetical protein
VRACRNGNEGKSLVSNPEAKSDRTVVTMELLNSNRERLKCCICNTTRYILVALDTLV